MKAAACFYCTKRDTMSEVNATIKSLVEHVCGQAEFDEDKAFEGLEDVIDYDWQKRFIRLLGRLADSLPQPSANLTAEQKANYVNNRPGNCPFCGSNEIEGDSYNYEGESVAQRITCNSCERQWDDVYTLTDVEEVESLPDPKDPNLNYDEVELNNGGCLEWDNGTIRYIDCDGNTEGVWQPGDDDYQTYKSQYFPNHTVTPTDD